MNFFRLQKVQGTSILAIKPNGKLDDNRSIFLKKHIFAGLFEN